MLSDDSYCFQRDSFYEILFASMDNNASRMWSTLKAMSLLLKK